MDAFIARRFAQPGGRPLPYRLLIPRAAAPAAGHPVVLFLHGAGERGDDNRAQLRHGAAVFAEAQERFPAVIVAPQCPAEARWVEVPWDTPSHSQPRRPSPALSAALSLLDALERELPIDGHRRYVTGLSMGGYGTWDAAARHPERFAAAVPVCGGGDLRTAARLAALPIWAFHGSRDDVVPPSRSRDMIRALHEAGGAPRYTEYDDLGHDCWDRAYREPALLPWLLSQRRP